MFSAWFDSSLASPHGLQDCYGHYLEPHCLGRGLEGVQETPGSFSDLWQT